jgi:hypothetical protein
MTLTFRQSETCEGLIRYLASREKATLRDVQVCDEHPSRDARVEMIFRLGNQLYAIEHTGIEPFEGFMEHQNKAAQLFEPLDREITAALDPVLKPDVIFEMCLPVDAFKAARCGRCARSIRPWSSGCGLPPRHFQPGATSRDSP